MRTIKHFWDLWVATPTPLKVLYFALACGLAAAIGDFEFGSNGERQVMDFFEGLLTIVFGRWRSGAGDGFNHACGASSRQVRQADALPALRPIKRQLEKPASLPVGHHASYT
jgi:hypothetical protein